MNPRTLVRLVTVIMLAVVAVTIAVTFLVTVEVPELRMKPRPYAPYIETQESR